MQQGLKVAEVLDDNVEKLGKSYIKEKFHNSHKKYMREINKAEEFAKRNLNAEDGHQSDSSKNEDD
ncbi:Threonine--tRNA ligase [Frankliniella fusca]|uniref:Threonine--tRNA ligase n=1 Tax=Frankliniella fusca TaxID=407009 RepID=A0AAE1I4N2_9NEOP|nr:Threonine--tRNA ligase [Frankliniella fusca]